MTQKIMPEINRERCTLCGDCVDACPQGAVTIRDQEIILDEDSCAYCGDCEDLCPMGAIALPYDIVLANPNDAEEMERGTTSDC